VSSNVSLESIVIIKLYIHIKRQRLTESVGPGFATPARRHLPSALRNIFSNWAGFICSSIISFFLSPFVVHHLGNSAYGIWILMGSLTGYLGLLNLGVRGAVTKYVAQLHAEAKEDRKSTRLNSSHVSISYAVFCLKKKKAKGPLHCRRI